MNIFTVMSNVYYVSGPGFESRAQRVVLGTFSNKEKAQKVIDEKVKSIIAELIGTENGDWGLDLDQMYEEYYDMFIIVETILDNDSEVQKLNYRKFNDYFLV